MKGEIAAAAFILLTFGAEAVELCVSPSKTFQGPCVDNADCAAACHTEGFLSGYCHIVRSRGCRCSTYCEDDGGDGEGDGQAPSPDDDPSDDGPTAASAARARRAGGQA
ncbi:hypothetical protein ACP70R_032502 [Stipagrostis hirtigluma subsp. patula]